MTAADAQVTDTIVVADLDHPSVGVLLDLHLRSAHENSPAGLSFTLDLDDLRDLAVTLWAMWRGDRLLGLGALNQLDHGHAELKSMRTAPDALRQGVGTRMLIHLIDEARRRGYRRLSLETGGNAPFAAARAMYERAGFSPCGPFGDYEGLSYSRYYTLAL